MPVQVSRLVIESGISAVSAPLRVLMPLAAAAHTLRIVSLTAQILGDGRTWGSEAPKHLSRAQPGNLFQDPLDSRAVQHLKS